MRDIRDILVIYKADSPDTIQMEMKITMSLFNWELVRKALRQSGKYPMALAGLSGAIGEMTSKANVRFRGEYQLEE